MDTQITPKPPKTAKSKATTTLTFDETMSSLAAAGSAQTCKIYKRHGAVEPMFGVSFAVLKTLVKRIGVNQSLAQALWDTGNYDARMLALKVADPKSISAEEIERWAATGRIKMCANYLAQLAAESPHGRALVHVWLASKHAELRCVGRALVAALAMIDSETPDSWFAERLQVIETTIHAATSEEREAMNHAVIAIGCRSAALRIAATAAADRIGAVEVDHGETACKTPDAHTYIDKTWAHSLAKGFASPAAHERSREPMRLRC